MRFLSCENCFWLHSCSKLHKILKNCGARVDLRAPFHLGPSPPCPPTAHAVRCGFGETPELNSLNYGPSFACDLCDFWSTNARHARGLGCMELMRAKPHADCCNTVDPVEANLEFVNLRAGRARTALTCWPIASQKNRGTEGHSTPACQPLKMLKEFVSIFV